MGTDIFKHENGLKAVDKVTGFKGTITARCDYLDGTKQYMVTAKAPMDGKAPESIWIDESRVIAKLKED